MSAFLFNGIDLTGYLKVSEIRGRGFAETEVDTLSVMGMDGVYIQSQRKPMRKLEVDASVIALNREDLRIKIDELNEILSVEQDVPIIFLDEPNMTYFGRPETTSQNAEYFFMHKGTITFLCSDPYKYGEEQTITFTNDVATIENAGTAEADPVFTVDVQEDTTFLMLQKNDDQYIMIGQPVDVTNQEPVQEYQRLIYNPMNSLTGFTTASKVENSYIQGTMEANGSMIASDYDVERPSEFYGPAVKTSVSEVLSDFMVDMLVTFENDNNPGQVGKVELYLYDELDNVIGKLALQDAWANRRMTTGIIRIGDQTVNNYMIDENNAYWNGFYGILRILKKGDYWEAYIAELDENRKHHTRKFVSFKDNEGLFTGKQLAQVGIHIAKWGAAEKVRTFVHHLSVSKINSLGNNGVPYIAKAGDTVTFDHKDNGQVYINGEVFENIDFGSTFFKVEKDDQIVALSSGSINPTGTFRPRYR